MNPKRASHGSYPKYNAGCRCGSCKRAHATENRRWLRSNKDKVRIYNRRKNLKQYGLTLESYDTLLAKQGGRCAICRRKRCGTGKRLAVDHDHTTQIVRGLLCYRCNSHLGWFEPFANEIINYLY